MAQVRGVELKRTNGPKISDFRGQNRRTIANLQTRLTPEEVAEMVALYADGIPAEVLADLYGVCRDTVIHLVRRADAVPGRIVVLTDADVTKKATSYQAGVGLDKIAAQMYVSRTRTREVLVNAGIDLRLQHGGRHAKLDARLA